MRRLLCALGLVILALLPNRAASAESLDDYKALIQKAVDSVRAAEFSSDVADQKQLLATAADLLESAGSIALPDGDEITPDNTELIAALRDEAGYNARAHAQLEALNTLLGQHASVDHSAARAKLRDVFAAMSPSARPPNPVVQWLTDLLERFLRSLGGSIDALPDNSLNALFIGAGGIALILITTYFARNLRRASVTDSALATAHDEETPLSSTDALSRAQQLAGTGDYRTAVRQLYLGTLLILDERGKLRFDKSLTNIETLRTLRAAGADTLADALRPIVDYYDRVWYGFAAVQTLDYERYRAQVEAVKSA